jgi:hypothetical protein
VKAGSAVAATTPPAAGCMSSPAFAVWPASLP